VDLFTPIVTAEKFNPNFRSVLIPAEIDERRVVSSWADGFVDRDGKFVQEFQTTFNSSFWELYLHAVFRKFGITVDWRYERPDFLLTKETMVAVVEATTANAAHGHPNEWDRELTPEALLKYPIPAINREATIRLSNAVTAKHRKYCESYRKLSHVAGRPFVIAVSPFEQPFFNLQHDRPIRSLLYDYYVDEEAYYAAPGKYPNGPPGVALGSLIKDNGGEIELGFFKSNVMEEISAVLFTCLATWGKVNALADSSVKTSLFNYIRNDATGRPVQRAGVKKADYRETLEDGLQIYHNPFAKVPLDPAFFRAPGVVQHFYDPKEDEWCYEGNAGALLWRQVWGFTAEPDKDSGAAS